MKQIFKILLLTLILNCPFSIVNCQFSILNSQFSTLNAQTLNIKQGNVIYQFPASQAGEMQYSDGTTLTVMGKTFTLSDISSMTVDNSEVTDNLVSVEYGTSSALVRIAGNVAQYVEASVDGAHVSISQWNTAAVDGDELTYQLSGSTSNGSLTLAGQYKCTVSLAGVSLTNPSGAAINITNSKRIQLSAKKNTVNTLTDGSGSQKACIYSKGQLQLQGNGTLNVIGNCKHGIKSASYITIKNLILNITKAVSDGINCEEYFQMKGGTVTISGVGDDAIQCDLDGTTSTGETTDHEDEDSGNMYIEDGTLTATVSASSIYDADESKVTSSACLNADGDINISGGTLVLKATGAGGKGISTDGSLTISDGSVNVSTTGQIAYYSNGSIRTTTSSQTTERLSDSYKASPKGIKVDGDINISSGSIVASATYHEAIESKSTINISGGYVYAFSGDDAINSSGNFTISGGYVFGNSSGNDGLDANGNFYITGGNVVAVSSTSPEVGIDANTEGGYKLYISGGNVVAIGGFESGASITNGTAKQASSYTKGAWYGLNNGSTAAFAFKVPSNSSMGSTMAVYTTGTPSLYSGVTGSGTPFLNSYGYPSFSGGSNVTLSTYSGGGGGGGRPGRW